MTIPPSEGIALDAAVETDDDWLTDLDLTPNAEAATDENIMKAMELDEEAVEIGAVARAPVAPVAGWLTNVRELARKHGPFAPWQIVQIICARNAVDDPAADAATNR